LLEAMSIGCCVVASDTAPVREVIKDGYNGVLVDFFSASQIVSVIQKLLTDQEMINKLGVNARKSVVAEYDLEIKCLPKLVNWAIS